MLPPALLLEGLGPPSRARCRLHRWGGGGRRRWRRKRHL